KAIFEKYIKLYGKAQVNIPQAQYLEIEEQFTEYEQNKDKFKSPFGEPADEEPSGIFSPDLFEAARNEVFLLMEANFFHQFYRELRQRTGAFANLLHRYELIGYSVVREYFASVRTELDRLQHRYQSRKAELVNETKCIFE